MLSSREIAELLSLMRRIDEHAFNCPYDTTCCQDCAGLRAVLQAKVSSISRALNERPCQL